LVKMTAIVGYIAVQDLTKAGDIITKPYIWWVFSVNHDLPLSIFNWHVVAYLPDWAHSTTDSSQTCKKNKITD
jgi:hypothetical protein